jgi:trimeric autotransporter adhesin
MRSFCIYNQQQSSQLVFKHYIMEDSMAASEVASEAKRCSGSRTVSLFESAALTTAKLESQRELAATAGCTFTPRLLTTEYSNIKREEGKSVHESLFHNAAGLQAKLAERQALAASSLGTFTPDTSLTAANSLYDKVQSRLYQPSSPSSLAAAEAAAYKECTFSPKIKAREANEKLLSGRTEPLVDRLFSPDQQRRKEDELAAAREKAELNNCTFTPQLIAAAGTANSNVPVHERLFSEAARTREAAERRKTAAAVAALSECTFMPQRISTSPSPTAASAATAAAAAAAAAGSHSASSSPKAASVHSRLYAASAKQQARSAAASAEATVDPECTFSPRVSRSPRTSRGTSPDGATAANGSNWGRFEELYKEGKQVQQAKAQSPRDVSAALRAKLEQAELAEHCTFRPNLRCVSTLRKCH